MKSGVSVIVSVGGVLTNDSCVLLHVVVVSDAKVVCAGHRTQVVLSNAKVGGIELDVNDTTS